MRIPELIRYLEEMAKRLNIQLYYYDPTGDLDHCMVVFRDIEGEVLDIHKIHKYSDLISVANKIEASLLDKLKNGIPTSSVVPPNMLREYLDLDPVVPVDKDKQIVKILEGKSAIIQFDSILSKETMKQIKDDIQNQIKENGFAVVDNRCRIIEIDNSKAIIETK